MRIAISNPDSIGDFVLRQPMFAALAGEGHELLLIVRDFVAPMAEMAIPEARVVSFAANPYTNPYELTSKESRAALEDIVAFQPELFVAVSYQFTRQEEQIAGALAGVETVGFNGKFFAPGIPRATTLRRDRTVAVGRDEPELAKNERLCSEILGHEVRLQQPVLETGVEEEERAGRILEQLGWDPGSYAVVCAGASEAIRVRNWERHKWVELLRRLMEETQIRLLFLGSAEEDEESEAVRAAVGGAEGMTAGLTAEPPELGVSAALIGLSRCYIGRDTGPMHIAAAMGRPVLALFGGGTWPRFLPAADASVVLTVDTPCRPCDWQCHMRSAYCVKSIPVEQAWEAASRLLRGEVAGNEVEMLPAGTELLREMCDAAAVSARERGQEHEAERQQYAQWVRDRDEASEDLRNQLRAYREGIEQARTGIAQAREEWTGLRGELADSVMEAWRILELKQQRVSELELRLETLREQWARRLTRKHARLMEMRRELEAAQQESREQAEELRSLAERRGELQARVSELAAIGEELSARLREALLARDKAQSELAARSARLEGRAAELEQRLERERQERRQVFELVPELRDNLAAAERELEELRRRRALPAFAGEMVSAAGRFLLLLRRSTTLRSRG